MAAEIFSEDDRLIDNDIIEPYNEPYFAYILRCFGCLMGYTCMPCCYPYQTVDLGYIGIIQEFGRVKKQVPDGMHYVNPITEKMFPVSMKVEVIDLGKQNVMTSEKLSITIDSVVYCQVINAYDSRFKIQNVHHAIVELSHTTLRTVIGNSNIETCLGKREEIANAIKQIVEENVRDWGISIISIQIKDIFVPQNIISSLSSTVTAEREGRAKVITAQADVESAKLMREAADILNTPAAMQIRSLEVIDKMASNPHNKVVLIPSDLSLKTSLQASIVANSI
ncbi:MAG: stomatin family protein/prohibitin-family membrane protease subunit [Satyrvirus sp.]|uniref:Stomatin family protein/prohibitin-family membrane protease subunit n=1 Tax=Satyrvirus sp. TaxID=2487771 RepID=A0A3G5AGB2_9VIRU|nr:MAG: stomatin family protein/prohibitin-family membrane protease subunit [Satyrvirus sp.]